MNELRIEVIQGDITKLKVDAIVNAANSSLMGGGGVDGAIHRAAGPKLKEECIKIVMKSGNCRTGEAVITGGCNLLSKYVIHTVGPVYKDGMSKESELLGNAYKNSLRLGVENKIKSIAFPNISTGIFGYPKKPAAEIAVSTVLEFLRKDDSIEKVIFVCFDYENFNIYKSILDKITE
ncbi:MAG: O-acetyl-ADP-ribose deacetylase [Ignavibacteriae bacterium]|nr:O-acetyl-ADP-ribose deacetylase [Ignavibacteriota bacterium]